MALSIPNMNSVHPGTARLWVYASGADAIAAVSADGYFDSMGKNLLVGDVIIVAPDAGTAGVLVVTVNNAGDVTVA